MARGALVGFVGGGSFGSAIGGVVGAIAASKPGKIGGRKIGEQIDEFFKASTFANTMLLDCGTF
ncbi:hypothetical protein [Corynebacterium mustelae]|nr:hypothetical protein [Corynebacterium mustelae]